MHYQEIHADNHNALSPPIYRTPIRNILCFPMTVIMTSPVHARGLSFAVNHVVAARLASSHALACVPSHLIACKFAPNITSAAPPR
ncbi:MAG: hypothetical protein WC617_18395 [Rhodanobacter sp.]|jgi:hypothetical protein